MNIVFLFSPFSFMMIFINGTFGVGKTTVAEQLVQTLPNSLLFDPEEVGFLVRNILSKTDKKDDFQDYPMWRTLTIETARQLKRDYGRDLVIPMTIWRPEYFSEVTEGLKQIDPDFHHFCLTAPIEVIQNRLAERGDTDSWGYRQAELAVPSLQLPLFSKQLPTENRTPVELVQMILKAI